MYADVPDKTPRIHVRSCPTAEHVCGHVTDGAEYINFELPSGKYDELMRHDPVGRGIFTVPADTPPEHRAKNDRVRGPTDPYPVV